jgi:hypothetical protein
LGVLSAAWVFRGFYRRMGTPLSLRQGVALLTMPMLGAYLPGRALCVAGHMGIAQAMGVALTAAGAGVVLLAGLGLLAALLVGVGFLLVQPIPGIDPEYMRISLTATLVLALVVLHPRLYFGLINYILRRLKRQPLEARLPLKDMLALLAGMCGYVTFFVAGFVALGRGIMDLPMSQTPMMIGAVTLATTIGFLSIFTPAGLGVREGLLMLFLARVPVGGGAVLGDDGREAVLTVSLRLMQIIVDVSLAGLGALIFRVLQRSGAAGGPDGGRE